MRPTALMFAAATSIGVTAAALAAEPMEPSAAAQVLMSDAPDKFLEAAASANRFEIQASQLALQRSQDPAIRKFAQMMVKDHTQAGEKVSKLAASKSIALKPELLRRHQMMFDGLEDEKGQDFDEEYRTKMVLSHKEAVSLFDESARESEDADVKKLAAELLPTLQAHGGQAKKLKAAESGTKEK